MFTHTYLEIRYHDAGTNDKSDYPVDDASQGVDVTCCCGHGSIFILVQFWSSISVHKDDELPNHKGCIGQQRRAIFVNEYRLLSVWESLQRQKADKKTGHTGRMLPCTTRFACRYCKAPASSVTCLAV